MERLGGEHMGRVSSIRQVAIASLVGTALEWYDYFLYGTAANAASNQKSSPTHHSAKLVPMSKKETR